MTDDRRARCAAWEWDDSEAAIVRCPEVVLWTTDIAEPVLCVPHWDRIAGSEKPMPGPGDVPIFLGGR